MPPEPLLDHQRILDVLQVEYGLKLTQLTYLKVGTAHAYRAEGPSGRYFVKLLPDNSYGQEVLERITREIPLLHALREQKVLERVPRVVRTELGGSLVGFDQYVALVYHWIDAQNVEQDWQKSLPTLVPLLGRLHAGTPRLWPAVPHFPVPPEDFAVPFQPQLSQDLQFLLNHKHERAGAQALRDLLLPHQPALKALLAQVAQYQTQAQQQQHQFVACHTDAHGWNVMRDGYGQLWLIDWETARLAPPEHDLWMLGPDLPDLLAAYQEVRGARMHLSRSVLGFYLCRRILEDLAMDVKLILHENTRPEQDEANLNIIEKYVLPDLLSLNERLERFETIPGLRV